MTLIKGHGNPKRHLEGSFVFQTFLSTKNKNVYYELRVKFYLGQNQDYSPGERISDSSEKLLQRVGERSVLCMILVKGGRCSQAHLLAEAYC